jgi:four helix bundle protein
MAKIQNTKQYDLEERTLQFAKRVIALVNRLPKTLPNIEIGKQLVKSSGPVGADYIEANESLSKKDFFMRIKICRKEVKESRYWLKLIQVRREDEEERECLIMEATELMKIFGSIVEKSR